MNAFADWTPEDWRYAPTDRYERRRWGAGVSLGLLLHFTGRETIAGPIRVGDTVLHGPTGETWVVCRVDARDLYPCGWPLTCARISDCVRIEKASDEYALKLLHDLARIDDQNDPRCRSARYDLGLREVVP